MSVGGSTRNPPDNLSHLNVLLIIPQARYKDEEIKTLRSFLERKKIGIKVAAPARRDAYGMGGMRITPDLSLDDASMKGFDAVIFIGGMGTRDLWDDARAHRIAREATDENKFIAAISIAPIILGRAGLLNGREATVYFSETKQLNDCGAKYTGNPIAVSDHIITCKGPEAVEKLAMGLIKLLSERDENSAGVPPAPAP